MTNRDVTSQINDVKLIVEELHELLHEDALHRLRLYRKYAYDPDENKWTPSLYHQCQLVEALRRKLNDPI